MYLLCQRQAADEKILEIARENGIVVLSTDERMYSACGKLYAMGLNGDDR